MAVAKVKNNDGTWSYVANAPFEIPELLPEVGTSNNGQVLTVVNGAWVNADPAISLPPVTTANNGAFLRVVNGEWAPVILENAEDGVY